MDLPPGPQSAEPQRMPLEAYGDYHMVKPSHVLKLSKTEEGDLDYVLGAEHSEENRLFVIPWSREKHLQALSDPDLAHLIVQAETKSGYVLLAGLPLVSLEHGSRRRARPEKGPRSGK